MPLGGMCIRQRMAIGGSGSTYVYGYVDSHVSDVKTKKECLEFVTNSTYRVPQTNYTKDVTLLSLTTFNYRLFVPMPVTFYTVIFK